MRAVQSHNIIKTMRYFAEEPDRYFVTESYAQVSHKIVLGTFYTSLLHHFSFVEHAISKRLIDEFRLTREASVINPKKRISIACERPKTGKSAIVGVHKNHRLMTHR